MIRLGVPQSEARKLMRHHKAEDVRAAVDFTKKRSADKRASKLENPAAYFRQALTQGWGLAQDVEVKRAAPADGIDPLEEEFEKQRMGEAESYFNELDASDQTRLIESYNQQQATAQLRVGKKQSRAARTAFLRWMAIETWGQPTAEELLRFAKQKLRKRA